MYTCLEISHLIQNYNNDNNDDNNNTLLLLLLLLLMKNKKLYTTHLQINKQKHTTNVENAF